MKADRDPRWADYPNTVLEFHVRKRLGVDLRWPVASTVVDRLRAIGLGDEFAVITPCNPRGGLLDAASNEKRLVQLRHLLRNRGIAHLRADGISTCGVHREEGFAAAVVLEQAVRLARGYEQSALFWFDGARFWLVPALIDAPATPLPLE